MLRLLTTHACTDCPQNAELINAADSEGESVSLDVVMHATDETRKSAALGLGLPVLVKEDGSMSKDAKSWKKGKAKPYNQVLKQESKVNVEGKDR